MTETKPPLKAATVPCGSCPYRRDVPSGIWAKNEYDKLPAYDLEMILQPQARFDCHQRDGNLCAGWLACHGAENLLSLRIPVFASGAEARAHGIKGIKRPRAKARKMIAGLMRKVEGER